MRSSPECCCIEADPTRHLCFSSFAYNGYAFVMDQKQAEDFVVDVVNHKYTFEQVVRIIKSHSHQQ